MSLGNSKNQLSEIVAALEALLDRDTILTRRQLAEKSEQANVPVAESSLASMASLAGGQMAPIQPPNDGFFEAVTFIGAVPPRIFPGPI